MFITIIEKRISYKVTHKGDKKKEQDWYVLLVSLLPFAPVVGTVIELQPEVLVRFDEVVYLPTKGVFRVATVEVLRAKPNAEVYAKELVAQGRWDAAAPEEELATIEAALIIEALKKLQSTILRTAPNIATGRQMLNFLRTQGLAKKPLGDH